MITHKALKTILCLLAEERDQAERSIEFNRTKIIPSLPEERLIQRLDDVTDALRQMEEHFDVRIVKSIDWAKELAR